MGGQLKLVLLLFLTTAVLQQATTSTTTTAADLLEPHAAEKSASEEEEHLWANVKITTAKQPAVKDVPVPQTTAATTTAASVKKTTASAEALKRSVTKPLANDELYNDVNSAEDEDEPLWTKQKTGIKISTPKVKDAAIVASTTSSLKKTPAPTKHVSDEILNDLIEASKHSVALADDPRFNKMLPEKYKLENSTATSTNKTDEAYDDYENYDYDEDYNYDETSTPESIKSTKSTKINSNKISVADDKVQLKPIKADKTQTKTVTNKKSDAENNDIDADENEDDDDDDYNEDDDDEFDDDLGDEEEVEFSENVPCPRYCVCERNVNSYLVATCSRFDPGTQKFGSDITDLVVTDVGPKYPIVMGPQFFLQMGLKHVSSIRIVNCTVEYLDPTAFHGLDNLYAVNLTNIGLGMINPDTFAKNKKLRILTISGNDLTAMSSVKYLLKSTTIEELDLSNNNLKEIRASAFSQLSNIVYINLSQNNIEKLPEGVFDLVATIEELDLSFNYLKTLPRAIFNRTALAILHLKNNAISEDLSFGTSDLQQLDLSFNRIHNVHHGMFDKMTSLTNLNLKGNLIQKIQSDSFLTLRSLRHIDLSLNKLDQLSSMLFYRNSELDVIRLNDNPRLSQLPTDGFMSNNGYFTVYFLDVSNCAIGALGHKTFSTMPHLATLKLAWNNINNLERDTFASLNKLTDLDLSNNLISKLDELLFMKNNDMAKLNLAGNPISKLSVRLFLPLNQLKELDVSECELRALLSDNQYGVGRKYKFYETLRSFNASSNEIENISESDIKNFKNLRTLDISKNPLKCNEAFEKFIAYVSLSTNTVLNKQPMLANLETASGLTQLHKNAGWAKLAHEVCKHLEEQQTEEILKKHLYEADKKLDADAKDLLNIANGKFDVLKDSGRGRKSEVVINEPSLNTQLKEDEQNKASEDKDDDEAENESDYDDDDNDADDDEENEDDYGETNDGFDKQTKDRKPIGITKKQRDEFLETFFNKDQNEEEEEIIIERGHIYYSGYEFLIPSVIVISSVIILLVIIGKIVPMVLRKRGERYRMALLASNKNSFVYQKLTEEIKPTEKELQQPKVHRYSPINQV